MEKTIDIAKGDLLLAQPFMDDENFKRTVILVTEQDEDGTLGLVLNRKSMFKLKSVVHDFPSDSFPLFLGGPVGLDRLNFIHSYGDIIDGSLHICDNIYWNGNYEQLKNLVRKGEIMPQNIKYFIGYSGWGKGQLSEEMQTDSWIVAKNFREYFRSHEYMWKRIMIELGGKYKLMSTYPEDPQLN